MVRKRKRTPTDLIGYTEIGARTGIPQSTLRAWKTRGRLPEPDFTVGNSPAWFPETIDPWITENTRLESPNNDENSNPSP